MSEFENLRSLQVVDKVAQLPPSHKLTFAEKLPFSLQNSAKSAWKALWQIQVFDTNSSELRVDIPLSGQYSPGLFYEWCSAAELSGCGMSGGVPPYFSASMNLAKVFNSSDYFEGDNFKVDKLLDDFLERIRKLCGQFPEGFLYGTEGDPTKEFPRLKGSGFGINAP